MMSVSKATSTSLSSGESVNVWYGLLMGVCGCVGLLLLGFISYYCYKIRQDKQRRSTMPSSRYESSHLLTRTNLDWPTAMAPTASANIYLSPIPEEFHDADDVYDEGTRDKDYVKQFCDQSEEFMWLDKPALYMGKNRSKRMYLLGRASMPQVTAARFNLSVTTEKRYTQLLCTIFPPAAHTMDLVLLRAFFKHLHTHCPHVLPVLEIDQMPESRKMLCITPYVPQGSLKDYIFHRCKTAMVQIPYHHKYKRHGTGKPLGHSTISRYGRDILLGMLELEHAGLPYYQLHSGNVLLHADQATLSGYEAIFFQPTSPTATAVAPQTSPIRLFGQLLFEMVFGSEWTPNRMRLDGSISYGTLKPPVDQVHEVLDAIFAPNADATLTIESILAMPLFRKSPPRPVRSFSRRDQLLMDKSKDSLMKQRLSPEMQALVKAVVQANHEPADAIVIQVA
ncbi:Aste57867_4117 [Aphanomyces stellatus]|uniref:Aste57867_4117 protein n=1 Tax=Aphanomyces stellatus TaxID=120398 RepID=A0A485KCL7_9STRA|nr:hypothetical protein As57867_004106 [Aphanomyces stellatus]VFT81247.1 Aste57867_4117 [Aphanomyces stellatus]